jgi:hypothetical protein
MTVVLELVIGMGVIVLFLIYVSKTLLRYRHEVT